MEVVQELRDLPLECIILGDNDRSKYTEIEELAESIDENGLFQPVSVRPLLGGGSYELMAGYRRYWAFRHLGRNTIPAIIRSSSDEVAAKIMWDENMVRVALDPMDEAQAIEKRMNQFQLSETEVASQIRKHISWVRDRLSLLSLIPQAQHLVSVGQLKLGYALAMSGLDTNRQLLALTALSQGRITLDKFRQLCGELSYAQGSESLFDMSEFMSSPMVPSAEVEDNRPLDKFMAEFRIRNDLPPVPIVKGRLGETLYQYVSALTASGFDSEAAVVATVYVQLCRANLIKPQK